MQQEKDFLMTTVGRAKMSSSIRAVPIPIGYHFTPTDQELIMSYLRRKVLRLPLPWDGIVEKELYGDKATPWELFSNDDDAWESLTTGDDSGKAKKQKIIYIFTKLEKVGNGSKNIVRIAGCGTWHGHTGAKDIEIGKNKTKIGSKRMFTFKPRKKDSDAKGHWIMYEYSLSDAGLRDINGTTDYVICKIIKGESKGSFKKEDPEISRISGHGEADDLKDGEALDFYVGCSENQEITQALGKRKSRDDGNYIPQKKSTPRRNFLDELPIGLEKSIVPAAACHVRNIGVDKDTDEDNVVCSNMAQLENYLAKASSCGVLDLTMNIASFPESQELVVKLPSHADNGLRAVCHMINGVTEDANGTATTSSVESNCNNNENNIDASAENLLIPQDQHPSFADSRRLLFDDIIDLSFLDDMFLEDSSAEFDNSSYNLECFGDSSLPSW